MAEELRETGIKETDIELVKSVEAELMHDVKLTRRLSRNRMNSRVLNVLWRITYKKSGSNATKGTKRVDSQNEKDEMSWAYIPYISSLSICLYVDN